MYTADTLDTRKGFYRMKVSVENHLFRFQNVTDKMGVTKGPFLEETSVPSDAPGSSGRYTAAQGWDVLLAPPLSAARKWLVEMFPG